MGRSKKKVALGDSEGRAFHSPFAELLGSKDGLPRDTAGPFERPPSEGSDNGPGDAGPAWQRRLADVQKVVVRRERKGRGGKTVTSIEGLAVLGSDDLAVLVRLLRRSLGCGAGLEDASSGPVLVLQGDHGDRVAALLGEWGVKRAVLGS